MKILNKSGHNTDPCGTPVIDSVHELNEILIFVLCHLLLKVVHIEKTYIPLKGCFSHFFCPV